jgi:hypothetical protein
MLNQLGNYQVKDMNIYIEPLIDELLKLWVGLTMYDISRPIGKNDFNSMEYYHGQFMMLPG